MKSDPLPGRIFDFQFIPVTGSMLQGYNRTMFFGNYQIILFDWGDTLMRDDPLQTSPMAIWPIVELVGGADVLVTYLAHSGYRLGLATSAAVSNENEIRAVLARVQINQYFEKIYCFSNTGLQKPSEAFYRHILDDLNLKPQEALMIGDSLEKDVLAPNQLGIPAIWYNPYTSEERDGEMHFTVHNLAEVAEWFNQYDHKPHARPDKLDPV